MCEKFLKFEIFFLEFQYQKHIQRIIMPSYSHPLYEIMVKWYMLSHGGMEAYDIIEEVFEPYSYDVIADLIDDSESEDE